MKKTLKWVGIILGVLVVAGFLAFLYFIPPFDFIPPEEFARQTASAGPSLSTINDPVERMLAERGKYLVTSLDCSGCHTPQGDNGPNWSEYLAGGVKSSFRGYQSYFTRNLTPDKETGLARRTDVEVERVLRTGVLPEGRVAHYRDMPWAFTSSWTEEDRHAVVTYLRYLKPVRHKIPDPDSAVVFDDPTAVESFFNTDYGHGGQ